MERNTGNDQKKNIPCSLRPFSPESHRHDLTPAIPFLPMLSKWVFVFSHFPLVVNQKCEVSETQKTGTSVKRLVKALAFLFTRCFHLYFFEDTGCSLFI